MFLPARVTLLKRRTGNTVSSNILSCRSRALTLGIRHLRVYGPLTDEVPPRSFLGTPVALVNGGAGMSPQSNPAQGIRVDELLGRGTVHRVRLEHPSDYAIERVGILGVSHEIGRALQLSSRPRAKEVARIVGHAVSRRELERDAFSCGRGDSRVVTDGCAGGVSNDRAGGLAGQTGNVTHVPLPELDPSASVVGKTDIASSLEHHKTEGEDVGRLVILPAQYLRSNVDPVALAVNARLDRPCRGQAKVANLQSALESDEDVRRLEIQVEEPMVMDLADTLVTMLDGLYKWYSERESELT